MNIIITMNSPSSIQVTFDAEMESASDDDKLAFLADAAYAIESKKQSLEHGYLFADEAI